MYYEMIKRKGNNLIPLGYLTRNMLTRQSHRIVAMRYGDL